MTTKKKEAARAATSAAPAADAPAADAPAKKKQTLADRIAEVPNQKLRAILQDILGIAEG